MPAALQLSRRNFAWLCAASALGAAPTALAQPPKRSGASAGGATPSADDCEGLDVSIVNKAIALGGAYLRNSQRKEGNFVYAYDWRLRSIAAGDSDVRQAGACWGLALVHLHDKTPASRQGALEALAFFRRHSKRTAQGGRFVRYPNTRIGSLGTVALVALAHIELLRAGVVDPIISRQLDEYLQFIQSAHLDKGGFHGRYKLNSGQPFGKPSPYFDGEALLALVKAARYLHKDKLRYLALEEAHAGYRRNVITALGQDPDSATTKGYYQWSSMAYFELADWSATRSDRRHGDRLIQLADWMIDVHQTLQRRRNTAYAYEGIVPAYAIAKRRGDAKHRRKFQCVINRGLRKLISWQVGGPLANQHIDPSASADALARGGVQNHEQESLLRIDVAQHQTHALLLARQLYFGKAGG